MNDNSVMAVNIPQRARQGHAIPAGWGNSVREAIDRLANKAAAQQSNMTNNTLPPLSVSLITHATAPATFSVIVSHGYVCETDLKLGTAVDALIYHDLSGDLTDANGFPEEFGIAVDEAIFVHVTENAYGSISNVEVIIDADDTESTNIISGVQAGEYYYKLAALKTVDGNPQLVNFLAGSHIYKTSGLTGDVLIEDCSGNAYDDPPATAGNILIRAAFISGVMVGLNESETTRPLSTNIAREQLEPCSFSPPP